MSSLRSLVVRSVVTVWLLGAARADAQPTLRMVLPPSQSSQSSDGPPVLAAQGLRRVFLNFDGVTLTAGFNDNATTNTSFILTLTANSGEQRTIAPFSPADLLFTGGLSRSAIIERVVYDLQRIHAPYNITFVTTRPSSGFYEMVIMGGDCVSVVGQSGCAGIAVLDCGDNMPANISFAFPLGLTIDELVVTAAQEMSHAFGLTHTEDSDDIMFPVLQNDLPTAYGAGTIPSSDRLCSAATFQDSHLRLLEIIGPRGQDQIAPTVTITDPADGSTFSAGTVVTAVIQDDVAVDRAQLIIDGRIIATLISPPWQFAIPDGMPPGSYLIEVRATDPSGNVGSATITLTSGECGQDADCGDGLFCSAGLCSQFKAGDLGAFCNSGSDCSSGLCGTVMGESRCSSLCNDGSDCPAGFVCLQGGGCWPELSSGGCGCRIAAPRGASPSVLLLTLVLMAGFWLRRSR
jgi:MYXO-CTERM domain-containing protein